MAKKAYLSGGTEKLLRRRWLCRLQREWQRRRKRMTKQSCSTAVRHSEYFTSLFGLIAQIPRVVYSIFTFILMSVVFSFFHLQLQLAPLLKGRFMTTVNVSHPGVPFTCCNKREDDTFDMLYLWVY
ncbi:hypothetical protein C1H46_025349 [Malus baccata]|uniref:Uncharacterized protein n=1 Tax=Malus baccata TaxID=106549 RepID=A0A540LS72_MALBA|nr:hypothetical protein C1H46_025349 [Malus baccata]